MKNNFAIVDIETTGGSAIREKIIEIAIVIFDGEKIIDSFESLVHPERSVPAFITRITGITDDMLLDAPKFYEIAKRIVEITENCIFVAHNSRFDYSFVQEEFNRLGFSYTRKQLCTVKLFRRFFPGLKSYSLGNLIKEFNISVDSRHRAMADVLATLDILKLGLKIPESESTLSDIFGISIKETKLPPGIDSSMINNLPEKTGVYYFLDMFDNIIYIGKSKNIRKRVKQHFQKITPKSTKLYNTVRKIDYELTGSEMIAFLKEAEEIKEKRPPANKALKNIEFPYSIAYYKDDAGYISFQITKSTKGKNVISSKFKSRKSAKAYLSSFISINALCEHVSGANKYAGACFEYGLGKCFGACVGLESPEEYNKRFEEALENNILFPFESFAIIDIGRAPDESSVVLIEDNNFTGYAYFNNQSVSFRSIDDVKNIVIPKKYDQQFNKIVKRSLTENSLKIISFKE